MTLQEFLSMIPASNQLHTGSKVNKDKRNAFENLYQLYDGLKSFMTKSAFASMDQETKTRITGLNKTLSTVTKIAKEFVVSNAEAQAAHEAMANGSLEQDFKWLQDTLTAQKNNAGMKEEADQLDAVSELLQLAGAGLEMNSLTYAPGVLDNAKKINQEQLARNTQAGVQRTIPQFNQKAAQQENQNAEQELYEDMVENDVWAIGYDENLTAKTYLENLLDTMRSPEFLQMDSAKQRKLATALLAARQVVSADRGNKSGNLQNHLSLEAFTKQYDRYMKNQDLQDFLRRLNSHEGQTFQNWANVKGHGGAFEDKVREALTHVPVVSSKMPERVMPTAKERIESIMKDIVNDVPDVSSDEFRYQIAAIFATREAVGAKRNNPKGLNVRPDASDLENMTRDLADNPHFKKFIAQNGVAVKNLCSKAGHGGAMEDLFHVYLAKQMPLPRMKQHYMPTAGQRIEALQDKIKSHEFANLDIKSQKDLYIQLLAARQSADVHQRSKEDLKTPLLKNSYEEAVNELKNSKYIDEVMNGAIKSGRLPREILKGHGGTFERSIMSTVETDYEALMRHKTDRIPDVPNRYRRGLNFDTQPVERSESNVYAKAEIKEINKVLDDYLDANNKFGKKVELTKADEDVIKQTAASSMVLSTELIKNKQNKLNLTESEFSAEVAKLQQSEAFQKMVQNVGIKTLAELTARGGSYVYAAFIEAQKELEGVELDVEINGQHIEVKNEDLKEVNDLLKEDDNLIIKDEEKTENKEVINELNL
ncbi:MAG: hypothetical protein J6P72_01255 [Firmicutes bacterium]|nr:hypothetical protein [Bacillota bacterium]